jgi:hypothetical protein
MAMTIVFRLYSNSTQNIKITALNHGFLKGVERGETFFLKGSCKK